MLDTLSKLGISGGIGLLLGLVAVWWVEPTTNGGVALLIGIIAVLSMVIGGIISYFISKKEGNRDMARKREFRGPVTNAIFISYRRKDSAWATRSLYEALSSRFGETSIFIDLDDIPHGMSFPDKLEREAGRCDVMIAVIGPDWLDAHDDDGNRRLDDTNDWVRREIAMGLARRIPVIPVLVDGARQPKEEQLPDNIKLLSNHNAIVLNRVSFMSDIESLCKSLKISVTDVRYPSSA